MAWSRKQRERAESDDALWEKYDVIRREARELNQQAFDLQCDPNATPEEKTAAWELSREAQQRRVDAHPDRVRRRAHLNKKEE